MSKDSNDYDVVTQSVLDSVKKTLNLIPRKPYLEVLRELRGKKPVQGIYIVYDDQGTPFHHERIWDMRFSLLKNIGPYGLLIHFGLNAEGFSDHQKKVHRCECGRALECHNGAETIDDGREAIAERIRLKMISLFTVSIIPMDRQPDYQVLDLDRMIQSVLTPHMGVNTPTSKNWVPIAEFIAADTFPEDIDKELKKQR